MNGEADRSLMSHSPRQHNNTHSQQNCQLISNQKLNREYWDIQINDATNRLGKHIVETRLFFVRFCFFQLLPLLKC